MTISPLCTLSKNKITLFEKSVIQLSSTILPRIVQLLLATTQTVILFTLTVYANLAGIKGKNTKARTNQYTRLYMYVNVIVEVGAGAGYSISGRANKNSNGDIRVEQSCPVETDRQTTTHSLYPAHLLSTQHCHCHCQLIVCTTHITVLRPTLWNWVYGCSSRNTMSKQR